MSRTLTLLAGEPADDPLRGEARFQRLVDRMAAGRGE